MTIYSAVSWPMAFCGWGVRPVNAAGLQLQAAGFCPSCAGRRMAQTAAHLVECVIPWVPTRPWVVSVPVPLRYWMAASQELTAKIHTIIRTTIGQYYVNKAVTRGCERANIQPVGHLSPAFGSAINLNLHFHCVFLEGVYLDRTDQGLKPGLSKPSRPAIPTSPPWSRRSAIGSCAAPPVRYPRPSLAAAVATGYDPLRRRSRARPDPGASVQQRIAFGERAGQQVRRIGSGFGDAGETPTPLTGPRCASVHGFPSTPTPRSPPIGATSWNA